MATNLRVIRQDDFTGGLNLRADQFQLAPNESPKMLNVEIDPRGGIFSRGAMRRTNTTAITPTNWNPTSLYSFFASTHKLMLSTGYSASVNGDVFWSNDCSSYTSLGVPVTSSFGASFASWGEDLYIATGSGSAAYKWSTGSAPPVLTALTSSGPTFQNSYTSPTLPAVFFPRCKHVVTHAGKIFAVNTTENGVEYPNRIRWSHPNLPGNWAADDYIDINTGSVGITAVSVFSGHIVVFKEDAVFAIFGYDSDTFQVVEVSRSVGAVNPGSVATTESGVYFYSHPDGLMLYNGNDIVDLFQPLRPALVNGYVNAAATQAINVNYINRRVWVSVPYSETSSSTHPTVSFVYDNTVNKSGAWLMFSSYDGFGISAGLTFTQTDGSTKHVVAHPTQPYTLTVDNYNNAMDNVTGTDNQFTSRYRTRWIDAGSYSSNKMFRRPSLVVKQTSTASQLNVVVYGNYEEAEDGEMKQYIIDIPASGAGMLWGYALWGSATWGAANPGSQVVNGRSIGLAKSVQLEFVGSPAQKWGVNSFTLKYNPRKVKA
jgi:hypothetical protein